MQQTCSFCKSRFFAEDEDFISGSWTCSYCMPKVKQCFGCNQLYLGREKGYFDGLCDSCSQHGKLNGFTNTWLILRFKLFQRDAFACRYCGRSPLQDRTVKLHADHIHPRSKGGTEHLSNLITACAECNQGKVDILLEQSTLWILKTRRQYGESNKIVAEEGLDEMASRQIIECDMADRPYVGERNLQTHPNPSTPTEPTRQ